jgi:predicted RNA binding protein YcfA (HicA-like mRNA interferase family)
VIRALGRAGFALDRIKGSHHIFLKQGHPTRVPVPHPKKSIPIGTLRAIMREAGLTRDEFIELL